MMSDRITALAVSIVVLIVVGVVVANFVPTRHHDNELLIGKFVSECLNDPDNAVATFCLDITDLSVELWANQFSKHKDTEFLGVSYLTTFFMKNNVEEKLDLYIAGFRSGNDREYVMLAVARKYPDKICHGWKAHLLLGKDDLEKAAQILKDM